MSSASGSRFGGGGGSRADASEIPAADRRTRLACFSIGSRRGLREARRTARAAAT